MFPRPVCCDFVSAFQVKCSRNAKCNRGKPQPRGSQASQRPTKDRPREPEAEPFLIIISFPILTKPPPPLTWMFAKPPNWSPCCCPGPLGPPVYLQQGSQRNPAKPKAGPAAATILQSPPFTRKKTLGVPVSPGTMRPTTPTFQASCPTSLSPSQQWSRRPPWASPRTHQHRPRTRAFARAHPSAWTTLSRPPRKPVPSPAANLAQMSPALLELTWSPYLP